MHPALRAAAGSFLPDKRRTLLLRACLLDADAGRDAWARFADAVDDVPAFLGLGGRGQRRLAPILTTGLARHGASVPADLLTRLRTASLHEELRCREVEKVLEGLLAALDRAGASFLLLKGAALGYGAYDEPRLRHGHDVNVLVPPDARGIPSEALVEAGFWPAPEVADHADEETFSHPTGLPLIVQRSLFRSGFPDLTWADLASRSELISVAGHRAPTLSVADHLHHVCVHAATAPTSSSLVWAVDAWHLIQGMSSDDWRTLANAARKAGSTVQIAVALEYLALRLDAQVPAWVRRELDERAAAVTPLQRDVALRAARRAVRWTRGGARPPLRLRLKLAMWWAFPSTDYIRLSAGARSGLQVASHRLARPFYWVRSGSVRLLQRTARRRARRRQRTSEGSRLPGMPAARPGPTAQSLPGVR